MNSRSRTRSALAGSPVALGVTNASAAPRGVIEHDALGDSYASVYGVPATTTTLVAGGQLDALDEDTDLVTLQIGGNDIGWSQAVEACLGGTDQQCKKEGP
jgi:lysophospholipase L1-like esterase